jgi:dolichyl-phosphate beta-glucosyltransferase
LHLAHNGGKAEAVRQGFLLAMRSDADYIGFWDADLATPLSEIDSFCRVLDAQPAIDAVIGTRMRLLGHKIERRSLRYHLGRLFARAASLALGARIFDTQCGAKMFRANARLEYYMARPFRTRWIFDVEIFARMQHLHRAGAAPRLREVIYELPLASWREVAGTSLKRADFIKAIGELSGIYWTYLRPGATRPAVLPLAERRRAEESVSQPPGDQRAA